MPADFTLGKIFFGAQWSSLVPFVKYATMQGLNISDTLVLLDLDQTVYAAKGRDDEPLYRARWDAVRAYLEGIVPHHRFDSDRAEAMYRQFDQDIFHPITGDNMDYVVLLVLAVASGLADSSEILSFADKGVVSVGGLAELLLQRASTRARHERLEDVLGAVKEIYYNTMAQDHTPCKAFRRYECLSMAAYMSGNDDHDPRIVLNREVVDFIHMSIDHGASVMAISDRPREAAVAESLNEDGHIVDLMKIRMLVQGLPLRERLLAAARL